MKNQRPDYFQPATPIETILRRIKGNFRRELIMGAIEKDGFETIPEPWLAHDLEDTYKSMLGRQRPDFRGGEDLPDLFEGEVEIARVTLISAVHGEVTSLRARPNADGRTIRLRIVDEYCQSSDYEYTLERDSFPGSLTAKEVLDVFTNSDPCACESSCMQRFSSDFYPHLDELADELGVKQDWEDQDMENRN